MSMRSNETTARDAGPALEDFAAELARAAYAVALRHGVGHKWLDLQLELWRVLKETVKTWEPESLQLPNARFPCDWA